MNGGAEGSIYPVKSDYFISGKEVQFKKGKNG
jgi:hypothetical protein